MSQGNSAPSQPWRCAPTQATRISRKELLAIRNELGRSSGTKIAAIAAAISNPSEGKRVGTAPGHRRLIAKARRKHKTIVDSGANAHVVKCASLLRNIEQRLRLAVKTATAGSHVSDTHGDLHMRVTDETGKDVKLENIGTGFIMENLIHSILSVSEMCKRGCTVVFKPDQGTIITPSGQVIPLKMDQGLYFIPDHNPDESRSTMAITLPAGNDSSPGSRAA